MTPGSNPKYVLYSLWALKEGTLPVCISNFQPYPFFFPCISWTTVDDDFLVYNENFEGLDRDSSVTAITSLKSEITKIDVDQWKTENCGN
jgi:hypothetical protein